jgi:ABC-2 type transport system permease protein
LSFYLAAPQAPPEKIFKMKEIYNIIIRELKSIFSSRLYILALLVFPIAGCLFLGGIYSSGFLVKLPAAVIDNDNTKISRMIIRYFDASPEIEIKYRVSNTQELKDLFARQKAVLGIYIPKDMQKNIKRQKTQNIPIYVNSANYISGSIVEIDANTIITIAGSAIKYKTLVKRGFSSKQARELLLPVRNSSTKLFNPSLNYNIFLTPGIWMAIIQQLLILVGVLSISIEFDLKTVKTMMRSCKGSVLKAMTGKLAVYMCFAYVHFEILYRIVFRIFGIPIISSVAAATALSLCFAFAAVSLGMLLSSVLRTTANALKGCLVIAAPAFLLSGYTWPPEQMPAALRIFAEFIPLTPFLEGFKKIYVQGLGIEFVMPYAKRLILYGIIFFISAYFITSARIKNAERKK